MKELDVIPENRSQLGKLSDLVREKRLLPQWIKDEILPLLQERLSSFEDLTFELEPDAIVIAYPTVTTPSKYAPPTVRLEFGGRSTGQPASLHEISCDMAPHVGDLVFPTATPRTMEISRIFWEKATAIHVYCWQGKGKLAERFSRHFHDLARLRETGHAAEAIAARNVAETVAQHKSMFFRMKAADESVIDYGKAVKGGLLLLPPGKDLDALRANYQSMIEEGPLMEDAHKFDDLIMQCTAIQKEANEAASI